MHAKHCIAIACRLSVCLSVTMVDQDRVGWKSWKLNPRTISPTPSLFGAQRPSTYTLRGTRGETRGGVVKIGVLEHKCGDIYETRKDSGKVTIWGPIGTHQRSLEWYHPGPLRPPLSKEWGSQPHPKLESPLSQEQLIRTSNLAGTITGPSEQKPIKYFGQKRAWAYPMTAQFFGYPYYLRKR